MRRKGHIGGVVLAVILIIAFISTLICVENSCWI